MVLLLLAGEGGGWALAGWRLKTRARGKGFKTLGWGRGQGQGAGARGRKGQEGRGRGLAGGKPLEALFPPAVKGHMKKLGIRLPIFTTSFLALSAWNPLTHPLGAGIFDDFKSNFWIFN